MWTSDNFCVSQHTVLPFKNVKYILSLQNRFLAVFGPGVRLCQPLLAVCGLRPGIFQIYRCFHSTRCEMVNSDFNLDFGLVLKSSILSCSLDTKVFLFNDLPICVFLPYPFRFIYRLTGVLPIFWLIILCHMLCKCSQSVVVLTC